MCIRDSNAPDQAPSRTRGSPGRGVGSSRRDPSGLTATLLLPGATPAFVRTAVRVGGAFGTPQKAGPRAVRHIVPIDESVAIVVYAIATSANLGRRGQSAISGAVALRLGAVADAVTTIGIGRRATVEFAGISVLGTTRSTGPVTTTELSARCGIRDAGGGTATTYIRAGNRIHPAPGTAAKELLSLIHI